jgi:leucine dehydrogenase
MSVFDSPSFDQHELVAFHADERSGLRAIVAIHNSNLGPALGGCRFFPYASDAEALEDVLRLSRGMSYKSALAGLPLGGGKAVIIGHPQTDKTRAGMLAMGDFVDSLGGRYITAEDSGTSVADMKVIAERSSYVSGVIATGQFGGDPSPYTAQGVFVGIGAALAYRRGSDDMCGIRVAVQGAGAVGRHLITKLIAAGATVFVADVNSDNLSLAKKLGAIEIAVEQILSMSVDVLAPCAMGAVINSDSVEMINADIIAGAANNQLATAEQGERLRQRGILYAPDFAINAGGIIDVYYQWVEGSSASTAGHVAGIAPTLHEIFLCAAASAKPTAVIAERLAEQQFKGSNTVDAA